MKRVQTQPNTTCCKVSQVLHSYGLDSHLLELERRWTGENGNSASLRELERELNCKLLRVALTDAGVPPIEGEAENLLRILNSSDVSDNRKVEAKRRLESDGVEVEEVLDDFVSHQTIHNHLRDCQGVSSPRDRSKEEQIENVKSTIFGLQNRTEAVAEKSLKRLGTNGLISPDEFDVIVDVQAICDACDRSHDVGDLLAAGGCRCDSK